jgi:hypothetical protein
MHSLGGSWTPNTIIQDGYWTTMNFGALRLDVSVRIAGSTEVTPHVGSH